MSLLLDWLCEVEGEFYSVYWLIIGDCLVDGFLIERCFDALLSYSRLYEAFLLFLLNRGDFCRFGSVSRLEGWFL